MLQGTDYADRPYRVAAFGSRRTAAEARRAALDYARAIEQQLGGAAQVVRCFSAWEREITLGLLALSRQEINAAATWRSAHWAAYKIACLPLEPGGELEMVLNLR